MEKILIRVELEKLSRLSYILNMSDRVAFSGRVLRAEPDGFAIIQFDTPIGPSANWFGLISSSTGTATVHFDLKPGVLVSGIAEAGDQDLAAIKIVTILVGS